TATPGATSRRSSDEDGRPGQARGQARLDRRCRRGLLRREGLRADDDGGHLPGRGHQLRQPLPRAAEAGLIDPGVASRAAAGWVAGLIDAMISRAGLDPDLDLPAEQAVLRTIL